MVPDLKNMSPLMKRGAIAGAVLIGIGTWYGFRQCQVGATPPPVSDAAPAQLPVVIVPTDAGVADPKVIPTTAQIVFSTVPSANATVTWGRKRLGIIKPGKSLVIVRPRDSGPLDVIVRADGYLPVHTRAHTFSDNKVMVKLTRPDQTTTLLGYRVPLDAGLPLPPELGEGMVPTGEVPGTTTLEPPQPAPEQLIIP